jgi:hypothetical protein
MARQHFDQCYQPRPNFGGVGVSGGCKPKPYRFTNSECPVIGRILEMRVVSLRDNRVSFDVSDPGKLPWFHAVVHLKKDLDQPNQKYWCEWTKTYETAPKMIGSYGIVTRIENWWYPATADGSIYPLMDLRLFAENNPLGVADKKLLEEKAAEVMARYFEEHPQE